MNVDEVVTGIPYKELFSKRRVMSVPGRRLDHSTLPQPLSTPASGCGGHTLSRVTVGSRLEVIVEIVWWAARKFDARQPSSKELPKHFYFY
jgi:hypothetical protein